jgi:hypothetical protein
VRVGVGVGALGEGQDVLFTIASDFEKTKK